MRGEDGLRMGTSGEYDLVVLDLMLPGVDGRDNLPRHPQGVPATHPDAHRPARGRWTRSWAWSSARTTTSPSPSGCWSCWARVKALLRRSKTQRTAVPEPEEEYTAGGVTINVARHRVMVDGAQVELRPQRVRPAPRADQQTAVAF